MSNGIIKGLLKEMTGEAFIAHAGGHRIVLHLVDASGKWPEEGYFERLNKVWSRCKDEYRRWYFSQRMFKLGNIQEVNVASDLTIVNVIALDKDGKLDASAFTLGLKEVLRLAKEYSSSVHLQEISDFDVIKEAISSSLVSNGVNVFTYKSA